MHPLMKGIVTFGCPIRITNHQNPNPGCFFHISLRIHVCPKISGSTLQSYCGDGMGLGPSIRRFFGKGEMDSEGIVD